VFSNELRGISWKGHIYSECGRMVGCKLYHIQPKEGELCNKPMRSWGLLLGQYWWRGMHIDVQRLVSHCMVCDRVKASFNAPTP
jgi:hypothetical protein